MRCITCEAELERRLHEGVEIDSCPQGHGSWLDTGELDAIESSEAAPRPEFERAHELAGAGGGMAAVVGEVQQQGTRACPACGSQMRKLEYGHSSIVMDRCMEHGIWLDQGELERIEAFAEGFRASLRPQA